MSSTTFILGAPSSSSFSSSSSTHTHTLPTSPALNLLPFSLGPSQTPHKSTSAPLSTYFHPRPAPPNTPGIAPGTPIAAFRGRAIIGQTIAIPRGYRGVVLQAGARPDHGGVEERRGRDIGKGSEEARAMTPVSVAGSGGPGEGEGRITRTRTAGGSGALGSTRGAGQVALSRPKRAAPRRVNAKKRVRLDSDDEGDEAVNVKEEQERERDEKQEKKPTSTPKKELGNAAGGLGRTPSKRLRTGDVPKITVQEPTPRKPVAGLTATSTEVSIVEVEEELDDGEDEDDGGSAHAETAGSLVSGELDRIESKENIVPSPATEDDPPAFDITPTPATQSAAERVKRDEVVNEREMEDDDRAVRILRPISTFTEFTLWTPDAPLAGFRADEHPEDGATGDIKAEEGVSEGKKAEGDPTIRPEGAEVSEPKIEVEERGPSLRSGWWRVGGGGEGGDEFVRATGEWLGMVEMLNEPVYLKEFGEDDLDDSDDDA